MSAPAVIFQASEETAKWINENHSKGLRLGEDGPKINNRHTDYPPAMWRSDGKLVIVVEFSLKRHRTVVIGKGRPVILIPED